MYKNYEIRRKDKEVTDRQWMEDILKRGLVMYLGLAGADGWPYVIPIGYGYLDNSLYFHGAAEGLKNDILAVNPRVCFQVTLDAEVKTADAGAKFSMKYRSVTGFGFIRALSDTTERNAALKIIMDHYGGPHTDFPEDNDIHKRLWVARLDIERMTGKNSIYPL